MDSRRTTLAAAGLFVLALGAGGADAADLKVVSGPAMARVLTELTPRIEKLTDRHLVVDTTPVGTVAERLSNGEPFDVAVVYEPAAVALLKNSRFVAGGLACIAWTRLGLAASPGSAIPKVTDVAALRDALRAAHSIGYNAADRSGVQFRDVLAQLGLARETNARLVDLGTRDALDAVARGEVEVAVGYAGEITSTPGVRALGSLPWQVQQITPIFAAIGRQTKDRDAARRLIAYLTSLEATSVFTAHDMDTSPSE